jgi:FixJ family two-component response regulator
MNGGEALGLFGFDAVFFGNGADFLNDYRPRPGCVVQDVVMPCVVVLPRLRESVSRILSGTE